MTFTALGLQALLLFPLAHAQEEESPAAMIERMQKRALSKRESLPDPDTGTRQSSRGNLLLSFHGGIRFAATREVDFRDVPGPYGEVGLFTPVSDKVFPGVSVGFSQFTRRVESVLLGTFEHSVQVVPAFFKLRFQDSEGPYSFYLQGGPGYFTTTYRIDDRLLRLCADLTLKCSVKVESALGAGLDFGALIASDKHTSFGLGASYVYHKPNAESVVTIQGTTISASEQSQADFSSFGASLILVFRF